MKSKPLFRLSKSIISDGHIEVVCGITPVKIERVGGVPIVITCEMIKYDLAHYIQLNTETSLHYYNDSLAPYYTHQHFMGLICMLHISSYTPFTWTC